MGNKWIIWDENTVKEFDNYETALAYYEEYTNGQTVAEAVFLAEVRNEWRKKDKNFMEDR